MDVIAHGLWGGAIFGRRDRLSWRWAFFWGMAPDLFAFLPAIVAGLFTGNYFAWARWLPDGTNVSFITWYSNHAYMVTHSLVVWTGIAAAYYFWKRKFPWVFAAAALHILCDIPLHDIQYFPTPYLWPLHTPLHDGIRWANPRVMLPNYALIIVVYTVRVLWRRRARTAERV